MSTEYCLSIEKAGRYHVIVAAQGDRGLDHSAMVLALEKLAERKASG